jgi:hypothetical protein
MARHSNSRKVRSHDGKRRGRTEHEANPQTRHAKPMEEEVRRLVLAGHALRVAPPDQFDPEEATRLKMQLDALILADQRAQQATDTAYFDWLEMNNPELFETKGRPKWVASEKVTSEDKALLDSFDQRLQRNIAANAGKKHGASEKTYADLADKSGDDDPYTVKQRVMRARRRQKALQETMREIQDIAALAETDAGKVVPPEEYERRKEKLLAAFRRVLRTK